jgi:hypothetical protein
MYLTIYKLTKKIKKKKNRNLRTKKKFKFADLALITRENFDNRERIRFVGGF